MKELKSYKDDVAVCAQLEEKLSDIETLIAMGDEENDVSLIPEIEEEIKEYEEAFEKIRIKTLLSGEYDKDNAIVSLHAGAGGTESCDWASMLYRMYTRWASDKGFAIEVLDSCLLYTSSKAGVICCGGNFYNNGSIGCNYGRYQIFQGGVYHYGRCR